MFSFTLLKIYLKIFQSLPSFRNTKKSLLVFSSFDSFSTFVSVVFAFASTNAWFSLISISTSSNWILKSLFEKKQNSIFRFELLSTFRNPKAWKDNHLNKRIISDGYHLNWLPLQNFEYALVIYFYDDPLFLNLKWSRVWIHLFEFWYKIEHLWSKPSMNKYKKYHWTSLSFWIERELFLFFCQQIF